MENQKKVQIAERGGVFEFMEKDGSVKNMVLVVSSNSRKTDKRVSTVMLGDSNLGSDVVMVEVDGHFKFVHCGMISYSMRNRLGNKICQLSDDKMKEIDLCILEQYGLNYILDQAKMYERMYSDLVTVRGRTSDKEDW